MTALEGWARSDFTADGVTHATYRKGDGPGVIVIHEIPGITPQVRAFAEDVVAEGHTVVMPHLFGTPGAKVGPRSMAQAAREICVSREFLRMATGTTTPVATWLRALARELHEELGGPGVGAVGMCFTGGYALAMLADAPIAAPVLAQPSAPFAVTPGRGRDLGLSPADLDAVKAKVSAGCQVLGLRYKNDLAVGTRFATLRAELGDNFIAVEFPGIKHSTLTLHRQQEGVDRVLAFFKEKLATPA
jgi:dienelactone hydrolase